MGGGGGRGRTIKANHMTTTSKVATSMVLFTAESRENVHSSVEQFIRKRQGTILPELLVTMVTQNYHMSQ